MLKRSGTQTYVSQGTNAARVFAGSTPPRSRIYQPRSRFDILLVVGALVLVVASGLVFRAALPGWTPPAPYSDGVAALGMRDEGILCHHDRKDDHWEDLVSYGILANEWHA